jgi:hypothetical protein
VVPQEAEKLHLPPPGSLSLSLSHAFSRSLVLSLARLLCLSLSVTLPCLHEFHFYSCICCPKKLKNRASLHRGRSIHRPSLDFSIAVSHSLYAMRLPLKGSGIYLPLSLGDSGSLSVLPSVRPSICPSVMLPHTQNTHARKHARARARTQGPTAFFHRFSATIYIYIYAHQFSLTDSKDPKTAFLYRLSAAPGLSSFKHVLLVASPQVYYIRCHIFFTCIYVIRTSSFKLALLMASQYECVCVCVCVCVYVLPVYVCTA